MNSQPALSLSPAPRPRIDLDAKAAADQAPRPRFTLDGDQRLEEHLETTCRRIGTGLRGLLPERTLEAVLLGGGYGRGEGGVLRGAEGDLPYNDLEFYVFLRGNRHVNELRHGRALHVLGEILTPQAGVDVEFRIGSLTELQEAAVTMFSYDLVSGHRWLLGDESCLRHCSHHRAAEDIPLTEATRLLMNRCTGLLLAQERLGRERFSPADADFVARNIAKAQLGAGDAVLAVFGEYHWSARERHRRLERMVRSEREPWFEDICRHHRAGVEFKLHPTRSTSTREQLLAAHADIGEVCREVWLWVEMRRLEAPLRNVRDYVELAADKCPETFGPRNALVNAKLLGPRVAISRRAFRHPRERVLNSLPLLLWQPDALTSPCLRQRLQSELRTTASDFASLTSAYRTLWSQVN